MKTLILATVLLSATSLSAAPSRTHSAPKPGRTTARKAAPAPAAPSTQPSAPAAQEESGGCFSCYFSLTHMFDPIPYEMTVDGYIKTELCKAKYCN